MTEVEQVQRVAELLECADAGTLNHRDVTEARAVVTYYRAHGAFPHEDARPFLRNLIEIMVCDSQRRLKGGA